MLRGIMVFREEVNPSQRIKMKNITPINEMIDPIDEIMFHRVYASG